MKKIFFVIFIVLFSPLFSEAAWYDNAWNKRIEIEANNSMVISNELDIPLYIDLSLLPPTFFDDVKTDGSDIIITSSDEVTPLDFELVSFDTSSQTGEIHFKADVLAASSNTSYFIYYANSGTNPFVPGNIWGDYEGVWHFNDNLSQSRNLGVATQSAMDGGDGGWAVLYGENPIGSNVRLAIDEDQISDTERSHTTEQVSYWVFESGLRDISNAAGSVIGETGFLETSGDDPSSVSFVHSYSDPVVVAIQNYNSGLPAVVRINNLDSDGFDVFLQNPTPSAQAGTPDDSSIYYLVMESGTHLLPGNIPVEVGNITISGVNRKNDWVNGEMIQLSPSISFVNPVVLGSVQTSNNNQWQTFWSSNGTQSQPADASNIYIGRHTGEELSPSVVDEILGYIIVESHVGVNGGFGSRAALGSDSVAGVGTTPPYNYPGLNTASHLGFSDSTVNNFAASLIGGVSSAVGQIGNASSFDGSGSRAPISGLSYVNNNNLDTLTASFWLQTSDTARSGIFDFDRSEYWELGLNFHNQSGGSGKISFDTSSSSGGIQDLNSSARVNDGNWHHVVAVFDASNLNDKKIYIDGQLDSSVDQHNASLGTGVTRYGVFGDGSEDGSGNGNANNIPYEGLIDEARIRHEAMDAAWIETSYNNQSDNNSFWLIGVPEQQNLPPRQPKNLFFNHTDAQAGLLNPMAVEVGGINNYIPYFSATYEGDGDEAVRAYIQVSTDSNFSAINYWDSGWFDLNSNISDSNRSENLEYDGGLTGAVDALLPLGMNDGGLTYYWRIAFEDDSGLQGPFSFPSSFSLLDLPTNPGNVSATKNDGGSSPDTFIVNWQDTSVSETSFEVEFREDTGSGFGSWQVVSLPISGPTSPNTSSWGMENTVNNAAYNFRVRSCNYSGCSTWVQDSLTHYTDPEAPVEVCSVSASGTQFNVSWVNRAIFDESTVEECEGASCSSPSFVGIASSETEPGPVISSGLSANTLYRWSVFADNGSVSSDPTYSNIEYTKPAAPNSVTAVRVTDSLISLSWVDASNYEDGFRIYVRKNGGAAVELSPGLNTVAANTNSYLYTAAEAGNEYVFEVRSHVSQTQCGSLINSELFSDVGVSNIVYTTPRAPLVSTSVHNADDDVEVFWLDQSSYEDGFNIYVRENVGPWSLAGAVAADVTQFTYTLGTANHVYDFYVESFVDSNALGNLDPLFNTLGPIEFKRIYTSPIAPNLSVSVVSSSGVDLLVSDTSDYELGFSLYDSGNDSLIQSISSPNVVSFVETGLTPNTEYNRFLRSYVENSGVRLESADSGFVTFFTLANSPSDLAAAALGENEVHISWLDGANPPGTEFHIENISTGINSGWVSDLLSFNENNLECGTDYTYKIKARNTNLVETGEELISVSTLDCQKSEKKASKKISSKILDAIFGKKEVQEKQEPQEQTEESSLCSIEYYRLIKKGLRGEDVRQVQECLLDLGFDLPLYGADGWYGSETYNQITSYQKSKALHYIDGIVGPETSNSLNVNIS